ncbi:Retrovirus-related Pol polyprotein from transposon 17.6 [Araneus ventricosus]|uniref:Retrovirus-related Pol polyprotein from transposon 17.6 n=1 Tax=Araneus ventricosus TaxID=182803 RepID=A0A4Y2LFS1_ARAVE|nr:Retrovirus-related Pol polyprotein from transposon 17.6 [Araneus ventricosus]
MPFGLKNAPYEFRKMISQLLDEFEGFSVPHLDDIAIFSNSFPEHLRHISTILRRIHNAGLIIKLSKCKFVRSELKYLGHVVGQGRRKPTELKVEAIQKFYRPSIKTEIRAFLERAGYYSRYIPMFSTLAAPLKDALKGNAKKGTVARKEDFKKAFVFLKNTLTSFPVLYAPNYNRQLVLQTDSSDYEMRDILSQINKDGNELLIVYLSKKFSEVEQKYSVSDKECAV